MNNVKELLPIGSVVRLEEGKKKIMVFGVKQFHEEDKKEYDYIAVLYPEGNIGDGGQFLFNHGDVAEIYFRGYESEERGEFITKLQNFYQNAQE